MASLVELTVAVVALHTPVPKLLAHVELLPTVIRHQLFQKLPKIRLREMELVWEAIAKKLQVRKPRDGFDPLAGDRYLFDLETQRVWEARLERRDYSLLLVKNLRKMKERTRNCRHVFWELEFLGMLERRKEQHVGQVDELMANLKLFVDVVRVLDLLGEYICKDNAEILLALRYLRSLEVQYLDDEYFCWETMRRLVKEHPHLSELKFVYGSLSDNGFDHLYTTLTNPARAVETRVNRCNVTVLEFVAVKLEPEGYRTLVALVGKMPQLLQLRVYNCLKTFDKKLLISAVLRLPALQRLFLGFDWLENEAFVGLTGLRNPLALRYLRLDYNNVSPETVETICRASMDGVLNLERLGISYNPEIGAASMQALTSMLASPVVGTATVLTHLDLCSCSFDLEDVTSLLLALGPNKTLTHLNIGYHEFYDRFGDILADFLLTNCSVTHLEADYVFLDQVGVSARLVRALESNLHLMSLSLMGNELNSRGASAILRALIKRAQVKAFTFVDLSMNQIELDGLKMIANILEGFTNSNGGTKANSSKGQDEGDVTSRKRQRVDCSTKAQRSLFSQCDNIVPIDELRLLNNTFNQCSTWRRPECQQLIKTIQRRVGRLESYEWETKS